MKVMGYSDRMVLPHLGWGMVMKWTRISVRW